MRKTLLRTALSLLFACSGSTRTTGSEDPAGADDDVGGDDDGTGDDEGRPSDSGGTDGGRPSRGDGGTTSTPPDVGDDKDFEQCADKRVDAERGARGSNIVWVVDNSGSMDEEAAIVQQNLNAFVQSIAAAGLEDYRVVLITEAGFVRVPDPLGSDTKRFLQIDENVKSDEPLSDLLSRYADYEKFLLPGVTTHFVTVTDDESEVTGENFVTNMKLKLTSDFKVHSIASPPGDMSAAMAPRNIFDDDDDASGCAGSFGEAAEPGVQHWEASKLTSGLTFSICSQDWSKLFTELAKQVEQSATIPCTIELPEPQAGDVLNPSLINVVYTEAGASDGKPWPRVKDAASCGTRSGWYYDDPAAPTGILLCPSSCTAAGMGGSLGIALGCDTFVQ
jgi:hypothetical protein